MKVELRRVTLEEYIEANGGLAEFLEGLNDFAKVNGLDWVRPLQDMMTDVERRARLFQRIGVIR
jgi:hypothetical protein